MKLLQRITKVLGISSYEAANPSPRRGRVPGASPTDTKKELTPYTRAELVRKSRYLHKNSGFTREVVADMAIYSTGDGIKPQAQTADSAWNKAAEEYFARWSARCEITNRFSFEECQSLVCRALDVDGEIFIIKVRDGFDLPRIQILETHRIGDGGKGNSEDGIIFDRYGAPRAYRVLEDEGGAREILANAVMHVFEPESASSVRQPPTLQHSINHLLDEGELLALEKHAVKDNADISRILKSETGTIDENGDFLVRMETDSGDASDPKFIQRIVGGKVVALKPGESLEAHQPNRPSPVFTGFLEHLKRDSAAGTLPYEFVLDPASAGGAGIRLVVAKADRRFSYRKLILIQRLMKPVWGYVIGDAIDRGELAPIENWNRVRFVTPRRITVDAGREAQQNRADVETGLKTLEEHFSELGQDFDEQLEIRAQNAKAILDAATRYGVPVSMIYKPSGTQIIDHSGVEQSPKEHSDPSDQ